MSTSCVGRATSSFIRSRRLVPPARNAVPVTAVTAFTAAAGSAARTYLNGRIGVLLAAYKFPGDGVDRFPCVHFPDSRNNIRVSTAAAQVPRHALAYLFVRELHRPRPGPHVRGHIARLAVPCLVHHCDGRTYLAGRAETALKAIVLEKGGLHRVQLLAGRQAFDRGHRFPL